MPLYRYQALSEKGKKILGTIDAENPQDAKTKLVRRHIAAFKFELMTEKEKKISLSKQEILNLTREMARLLSAGLPLFETLSALEEKYRTQKSHPILLDLCVQIRHGSPFSQSLGTHSNCFDLLYCSMVANAEKTGRLPMALNEIAGLLQRQQLVKKQLTSALLYPALLIGFCFVVLSSLIFYVIPSLSELFVGRDLHPMTKIVFAASSFACRFKGLFALFFISLASLFITSYFSSPWRRILRLWILRLPFFKDIFIKVAFIRFFRAAATLLEGGLSLVEAFSQARCLMFHPLLESILKTAEKRIIQGESIQNTFENHPLIPPLIPRMIGIAEQGGNLPFMMQQIAAIYEDELEKTLHTFATVAQPALLLVLGIVIGFVLLAVLLPMSDVSSFVTN